MDRASAASVQLTEAGYLILLSLAAGPAHGYRVMQTINDVFRTELRIGPGTLYRTLQRLTADGLIEETDADPEAYADNDRRKDYRLTRAGAAAAREEMRRLDTLVRLARVQLSDV